VTITAPAHLSSFQATYLPGDGFGASVTMTAEVADPDGDPVSVEWYSSVEGYLGTGTTITARLHTMFDSSQPWLTARAADGRGGEASDRVQVIVWIPSDS